MCTRRCASLTLLFPWFVEVNYYRFITSQVAIAKGHPRLATDSYRITLKGLEFDEEEYLADLLRPNASFVLKTVEELISILECSKTSWTPWWVMNIIRSWKLQEQQLVIQSNEQVEPQGGAAGEGFQVEAQRCWQVENILFNILIFLS